MFLENDCLDRKKIILVVGWHPEYRRDECTLRFLLFYFRVVVGVIVFRQLYLLIHRQKNQVHLLLIKRERGWQLRSILIVSKSDPQTLNLVRLSD